MNPQTKFLAEYFERFRVIAEEIQEDHDHHVCSHFGCGRKLSLEEQRYGNKCISHSINYEARQFHASVSTEREEI